MYLDEVLRNDSRRRVVEHSPQLPQGFTPVSQVTFWPGQRLEATCAFNSMERSDVTWAGATHHHEMCNLYMIMWSELPVFINCYDSHAAVDRHGIGGLPLLANLAPIRTRCKAKEPINCCSLLGSLSTATPRHCICAVDCGSCDTRRGWGMSIMKSLGLMVSLASTLLHAN